MKRTSRRRKNRTRRQRRSHQRTKKYRSMRGGAASAPGGSALQSYHAGPGCGSLEMDKWIQKILENRGQPLKYVMNQVEWQEHHLRRISISGHEIAGFTKLDPRRGIIKDWLKHIRNYYDDGNFKKTVLTGETRNNYELALTAIFSYGLEPFNPKHWGDCLRFVSDRKNNGIKMPGEEAGWTEPTFEDLPWIKAEQGESVSA
jgi:hypothetical protein